MKKILWLWGVSLFFKLILAIILPLSSDEAYYWVWAQNLQLSYYDHPGFIAWLLWLGQPLEFLGHAVRTPIVILGHLTLGVWIWILKSWLDDKKLMWWFSLALFSPMIGFGSIIATPDVPVMFFWSLAIAFAINALEYKKLNWYILLGIALGLGFCSKYHMVIFVPLLLLWLFVEKKWREVQFKGVLLTVIFGFLFSIPVLLWNFQNDFVSFRFQLEHGLGGGSWQPDWTLVYVFGQVILLFPIVFIFALWPKLNKSTKVFLYFGWGPLIFFFLTSFKNIVEANWPIMAFPAVFYLAVTRIERTHWILMTNVFWIVLLSGMMIQIYYPWMPFPKEDLKTNEAYRFEQVLKVHEMYQPFYASTYQMAAYLWYETKKPVYKLNDISRKDYFDFQKEGVPKEKKFYIALDENMKIPKWLLESPYRIKMLQEIPPCFRLFEVKRK